MLGGADQTEQSELIELIELIPWVMCSISSSGWGVRVEVINRLDLTAQGIRSIRSTRCGASELNELNYLNCVPREGVLIIQLSPFVQLFQWLQLGGV